jgi:predicted MPP superfamily phosphohydrolase
MNEGRMIAIGDIHGCSAALASLVRAIEPTPLDTLVFLGDYIDRGPDSKAVVEQVISLRQSCKVILSWHKVQVESWSPVLCEFSSGSKQASGDHLRNRA